VLLDCRAAAKLLSALVHSYPNQLADIHSKSFAINAEYSCPVHPRLLCLADLHVLFDCRAGLLSALVHSYADQLADIYSKPNAINAHVLMPGTSACVPRLQGCRQAAIGAGACILCWQTLVTPAISVPVHDCRAAAKLLSALVHSYPDQLADIYSKPTVINAHVLLPGTCARAV
jgi:energy-converting hydrogenase Eha subunit A